jgi:hypothetical protein
MEDAEFSAFSRVLNLLIKLTGPKSLRRIRPGSPQCPNRM